VLGVAGITVPLSEPMILASNLAVGWLVAIQARLPLWSVAAAVGAFGVFHGVAHGHEMPAAANPLDYIAGFVLGTAVLHGLGLSVAVATRRALHSAAGRLRPS
jgi:urease accessory protein